MANNVHQLIEDINYMALHHVFSVDVVGNTCVVGAYHKQSCKREVVATSDVNSTVCYLKGIKLGMTANEVQ